MEDLLLKSVDRKDCNGEIEYLILLPDGSWASAYYRLYTGVFVFDDGYSEDAGSIREIYILPERKPTKRPIE